MAGDWQDQGTARNLSVLMNAGGQRAAKTLLYSMSRDVTMLDATLLPTKASNAAFFRLKGYLAFKTRFTNFTSRDFRF